MPPTTLPALHGVDALVLVDDGRRWLRMTHPDEVLTATSPADVAPLLREVEHQTRARGSHAVGFLIYEAGTAFGLHVRPADGRLPLAGFALFPPDAVTTVNAPVPGATYDITGLIPSWNRAAYLRRFERIKARIADGDTYQVNCTFTLDATFQGDARGLFAALARSQRGRYAAWLRFGAAAICSASPELFVARRGSRLISRPMKGTARRGRTVAEDALAADMLRGSRKERAENVMVVDMVRNDLGRIARTGSVKVSRLFDAEKYPTVWQMTSEVVCESHAGLDEIMAAMFPSASITGAPKARTMEIIAELEDRPRGVYTGTVGYLSPDGDAHFNVAIRTAVVNADAGALTFGVGSGVVWDSDGPSEYDECLLKAEVLAHREPAVELIETLGWSPQDGYTLLDRHLVRLAESARYFDIAYSPVAVSAVLEDAVANSSSPQRVRLLVDQAGAARAERTPLEPGGESVRVRLARTPVDAADRFLFHKTTRRATYESRMEADVDDVLLWNQRGEVTESTIASLVVELDGALVTPPVDAGLLPGTLRAQLLDEGRVVERTVRIEDLERATALWLVNSVRGWRRAVIVDRVPTAARSS